MRACVQRVSRASVRVDCQTIGEIGIGLLVLLGVAVGDNREHARFLADKIVQLRIFQDEQARMNRSLIDVSGSMLVVSQFTLLADCRKGRRPSFLNAGDPASAEQLYGYFLDIVSEMGIPTASGRFGADMQVELVNDGPVTFWLDTVELGFQSIDSAR